MENNNPIMKVTHEIKAKDFLALIDLLSGEALIDNGFEEDELNELSFEMFKDYIDNLASRNETIQLLKD